ncbi:MAG: hypothetical protein ACREDZ_08770 [Kiloniellales bacterium]
MSDMQQAVDTGHERNMRPEIATVVTTIDDLGHIMQREAETLRGMDMPAFGALQSRKLALVEDYERQVKALRADPDYLAALPSDAKGGLRAASERLREAVRSNEIALAAARATNQKLFNAVAEALQAQNPLTGTYGQDGSKRQRAKSAVSVKLDQRF